MSAATSHELPYDPATVEFDPLLRRLTLSPHPDLAKVGNVHVTARHTVMHAHGVHSMVAGHRGISQERDPVAGNKPGIGSSSSVSREVPSNLIGTPSTFKTRYRLKLFRDVRSPRI